MFKKGFSIILIIMVILILSSCSFHSYYDDISDYSTIWKLAGFRHGYEAQSTFFPDTIDNMSVDEFYCRYDENLLLGESIEIYLKIHFLNEDLFEQEVSRISNHAFVCSDKFQNSKCAAYATRLGDFEEFENSIEDSFEYALLDDEQNTIYFIYLQNVTAEEVEFNHEFLPDDYDI